MEKNEKCIEVRNLKYVFDDKELIELGKQYAYANRQLMELEDQKKSVMAQLNSQISAQKEMVNILTGKVGNGHEYKDVECEISFHAPEKGMKKVARTDIDETRTEMEQVLTEKMTEKDWMLWNDRYMKIECDVTMHHPTPDQKTFIQRTTGLKFIENMTDRDKEEFESECEVKLQFPKDGMKTLTHKESGVNIEVKMSQSDLDKTQMSLFADTKVGKDELNDLDSEPQFDDSEVEEFMETEETY